MSENKNKIEKLYKNDVVFNTVCKDIAKREDISAKEVMNKNIDEVCIKTNEVKNEIIESLQDELAIKIITKPVSLSALGGKKDE